MISRTGQSHLQCSRCHHIDRLAFHPWCQTLSATISSSFPCFQQSSHALDASPCPHIGQRSVFCRLRATCWAVERKCCTELHGELETVLRNNISVIFMCLLLCKMQLKSWNLLNNPRISCIFSLQSAAMVLSSLQPALLSFIYSCCWLCLSECASDCYDCSTHGAGLCDECQYDYTLDNTTYTCLR